MRGSGMLQRTLAAFAAAICCAAAMPPVHAASNGPQILLVVPNSESMDGTTLGAIMPGSGIQGSGTTSLYTSSSPPSYAIPPGFTPPINAGSGGLAPYTATCGSNLCDNGPSRMNMTKAAIQSVVGNYSSSIDFGLYTYQTFGSGRYTTWVYYMSPPGGFTFTNIAATTATTTTVANPCYQYTGASSTVRSNCTSINNYYQGMGKPGIAGFKYVTIAATSDDPFINDVLYASGLPSVFVSYGPINTSTAWSLTDYNAGAVNTAYSATVPSIGPFTTTPTNAAYVPASDEVMYAQRGFGYGGAQSATTGQLVVPMGSSLSTFSGVLKPETNRVSTAELKSIAGQSPVGGLLAGAQSYLSTLTAAACQKQYVVLLTDGLPTMDLQGQAWPPLGSVPGNYYGVTASFNADGSLGSTNDAALSDAITAITNLKNAGITTYVIGMGAMINSGGNPLAAKTLQAMAVAGGSGNFFPATDSTSLNAALTSIANQVYSASSISAPVTPLTVTGGNALEYELTFTPAPIAGSVKAYPTNSQGVASTTASWDAAALMSAANRASGLLSTSTTNSIVPLSSVDAAAFSLTPTLCVPNTATIVNYTINPSFTYTPPGAAACSYLAGRQQNWFLGSFSLQNMGRYVGPPASASLVNDPTYLSFARSSAGRTPMLLFTNNDGFLYAVNASTGALIWAWTPRSILARLQSYTSMPIAQVLNGGFTVVDAKAPAGTWATYVVGSLLNGKEHYSLQLDTAGRPISVAYDNTVAGGVSPGDNASVSPAGQAPLHQPPQIAYINGSTYAVYVVNTGSTSTLYEVNVATGALTSAALSFQLSSAIAVEQQSNQLWAGSAVGDIWQTYVSGNAASDVAGFQKAASTVDPSTGAAAAPITYVNYVELKGVPYLYAINPAQVTVFGVGSNGWAPIWATTPGQGYLYGSGGFTATSAVSPMHSGGVVSDAPLVVNGALVLPVYVASSGDTSTCGPGSAYYDFNSLATGGFPQSTFVYRGNSVTTEIPVGLGIAFTPTAVVTSGGVAINPGSSANLNPTSPIQSNQKPNSGIIGWREW